MSSVAFVLRKFIVRRSTWLSVIDGYLVMLLNLSVWSVLKPGSEVFVALERGGHGWHMDSPMFHGMVGSHAGGASLLSF